MKITINRIFVTFTLTLLALLAFGSRTTAETVIVPAQSNDRTAAIMIDTFLAKQQAIKNKGIMVGAYNPATGLYENCTKGTAIVGNLNAQGIQLLINERQSADPNKPISITNVSNIADFICCVLFVGVNQCANNSAEDRAILAATYYPSDPVYDSAGNQIVNCDVSRNTVPGKAHQLGAKVTYNGVTDTFYYKPIGNVWTPSAAQIAGKPEAAEWENNANPTQEAINVLSMSFANLNSVLATKTPNTAIGCTASSGCGIGKWCSYGTCCGDAGQCGWGDGTNTPFECVANGGVKSNQWLTGICRNGVWKTQLNGAGCSSFVCDAGTCLNNVCTSSILGCTQKTCANINSSRPYVCGIWSDGCGGSLNCGTCSGNKTCNASGQCLESNIVNGSCASQVNGIWTDNDTKCSGSQKCACGICKSSLTANPAGSTVVAIKALVNGKYVVSENNGAASLIANRDVIGPWENFEIIPYGNGEVVLKSISNGKYVTSEADGAASLIANRDAIGPWERFIIVDAGNGYAGLKSTSNNKYVCAENSGNDALIANRDTLGPWETFSIVKTGVCSAN